MLFKITAERRKLWKDLLFLEDVASRENEQICCRHFSLLQINEVRVSRGCKFNILQPGAQPDMFLPGQETTPGHHVVYEETYFNLLY
jgi:hypothetical protein